MPPVDIQAHGQPPSKHRLAAVEFDEASIKRAHPDVEHERKVALYDLLEENRFEVVGRNDGPYRLTIGVSEDRLVLTVATPSGEGVAGDRLVLPVSLLPLRKIIKDYMLMCQNYQQAIRTAPPSKIMAMERGRRTLHDEASGMLAKSIESAIVMDHDTARRLFVVIVSLHWKAR